MNFLHNTSAEEIAGKEARVILNTNTEKVETISAEIFLQDGRLFIDCIPMLRRKHVVAVPEDAIISRAFTDAIRQRYGVFINPESEAGKFIQGLVDARLIYLN